MAYEICKWSDLARDFSHTLLVGNGGSVAVHREFGYAGLFEAAQVNRFVDERVQDVFTRFDTDDFELVLRRLWQAKQVNSALGIAVKEVDEAYSVVRRALIQTVQTVHVSHEAAADHLRPIYQFMRNFLTVVCLNYDLVVYWAAQRGNEESGSRYHFKDCFNSGVFSDDWKTYREPYGGVERPTIFCYPHGNLALGVRTDFQERKLVAGSQDLLNTIIATWDAGERSPLFVCDGTSEHKLDAILKSRYLRSVYNGPLAYMGESLVIYGWGIGKQEQHILDRIAFAPPSRVAVSVHGGMQVYCEHAYKALSEAGIKDIRFFDSASEGAWNNPVSALTAPD
ncbi:DUF4917 family protein [Paraburkholderia phenazinium]|uniref:DUF4917 family protein n=1 Tax=Paraburkholderia phenazinium TaxID=60549 RepID=UPI00158E4CE2|nr:DUF4917 family protein [Paraburkholderia phenazinium]